MRDGVYYADGRGNKPSLGKHSLNTRDHTTAIERLRQLDYQKAVAAGKAKASPKEENFGPIAIEAGWIQYLAYCGRSPVLGGVATNSLKRYQLIRDRHLEFCNRKNIQTWADFDKSNYQLFGNWMFYNFAYRTCYVDLTQIKAAVNWLINEGLLAANCKIIYRLSKPQGTDAYCYDPVEVQAMVDHCEASSELTWLKYVIVALSHLGLRFGELAGLRWTDVDLRAGVVRISDERTSHKKAQAGTARTTKGRRSRTIPLHSEIRKTLLTIPRQRDGRVFHSARGAGLRESNALKIFKQQVIKPLTKKFPTNEGDIGFEHGTFHSFRHYFCSQCFVGGASEGEVRDWLGHRDSKIVEHYRHLRSDDARRKMNQISFLGQGDDSQRPGNIA
jgi:integrase